MPELQWVITDLDITQVIHYWIAREYDLVYDPNDQTLCIKMSDEKLAEDFYITVTTETKQVSCQKCLEWLHA